MRDPLTVGQITARIADALDEDPPDVKRACDVIDQELFGPYRREQTLSYSLSCDLRGMIVAAYEKGKERGTR